MDLRIDDPGFQASVAALRRACADIASAQSTAGYEVATLLDGGWRGAAATAFGEGWDDWVDASTVVSHDLSHIADVIVRVRASVVAVDASSSSSLGLLAGRLG